MTRQGKIEFLIKKIPDRVTREFLETKSDKYIDAIYHIESIEDEKEVFEEAATAF